MNVDDAARAGLSEMAFLPEDLQRALDTVDAVKDTILGGQVPSAEVAREIIGVFGLPAKLLYGLAAAYTDDIAAQIREHGGNNEDVLRTGMIDGMMMGIALVLGADAGGYQPSQPG